MSETPQAAGSSLPSRKFGSLPSRSVNSIRSRGLIPTLRLIRSYAGDALFDFRYGVHTDRWTALTDLEVVGENKDRGFNYQPVKAHAFRSAMESFQIPPHGTFVDYGSGKGRVLLLAILYGFRRTVGVEFAQDLCVEAEHNLDRFRNRTGRQFVAHIVNVDAALYPVSDDQCVFFFYNPFDSKVLEEVLRNIRTSLQSRPRSIHVVYANPVNRQLFDDDPFWRIVAETPCGGLDNFVHYSPR
jgi:hypothetical protein